MMQILALSLILYAGVQATTPSLCTVFEEGRCPGALEIPFELYGQDYLPSESFLDNQCSALVEAANCFKDFLPCIVQEEFPEIGPQIDFFITRLTELCNEDSSLRKAFRDHSACINDHVDDFDQCALYRIVPQTFDRYLEEKGFDKLTSREIHLCLMEVLSLQCLGRTTIQSCGYDAYESLFLGIFGGYDKVYNEFCTAEKVAPGVRYLIEYNLAEDEK